MSLAPSRSYLKGQPISSRNPDRVRRHFSWILESYLPENPDLAPHLKQLLDVIEPRFDLLKALLPTCKIELFCGFSSENGQGGTTLDSALLIRLAKLPFDLVLDLYPPGPIPSDAGTIDVE